MEIVSRLRPSIGIKGRDDRVYLRRSVKTCVSVPHLSPVSFSADLVLNEADSSPTTLLVGRVLSDASMDGKQRMDP